MAKTKRSPILAHAGTVGAALALGVALLIASSPVEFMGWVRNTSFLVSGKYWPFHVCPGMGGEATAPKFSFRRAKVVTIADSELPIGSDWWEQVDQPTLARIPNVERLQRAYLEHFGDQEMTMRATKAGSNCSWRPPSTTVTSDCYHDPEAYEGRSFLLKDILLDTDKSTGNMHGTGLSLNLTYTFFDDIIKQKFRSDSFLSSFREPAMTALWHSNAAEQSTALQLFGHKLWLFMSVEQAKKAVAWTTVGGVGLGGTICDEDLSKIELTYAISGPGDTISFPQAWPHFVVTLPGPSLLINFRMGRQENFVNPFSGKFSIFDRLSIFTAVAGLKLRKALAPRNREFMAHQEQASRTNAVHNPTPDMVQALLDQGRSVIKTTDPERQTIWPMYKQLCDRLLDDKANKYAFRAATPALRRDLDETIAATCPKLWEH